MSEPLEHALPLLQAFQRFSEPYAAELVGDRPATRWLPQAKDARSQATNPFFERLNAGEFRCWGRHEGVSGPWVELRGRDAATLYVRDWQRGILYRVEWRPVERRSIASPYLLRDDRPWLTRKVVTSRQSSTEHVAEKWYDVRVAAPATKPEVDPYRTGAQGRPTASHLVVQEFSRRAEDRETEPSIAAEARVLCNWLAAKHPSAPPMKPGTIENVIREAFNQHRPHEIKRTA